MSSERLRAEIEIAILHAGGVSANTIVAGGDQACDPHNRGSGPLKANSLIILDIFPKHAESGYYGDLTRTVVKGQASEAQRKLWHTVLEAQKFSLQKIRAGGSGGLRCSRKSQNFSRRKGTPKEIRNGRWVGFFNGYRVTGCDSISTTSPESQRPNSNRARF